jgi:catechol 2,3-dioxygenase-like lactoylglutathione lyase family enzyme
VKRIGHAVLGSPKNQETVRWFRDTLGLVCSDDVYAGEKDNIIGQFSRIDAGDDYVDHHAFFCMKNERAGLNHFSFEVQDIDDVFIGHEYLSGLSKYEHMWGIGRHLLGSQLFDYWFDPDGFEYEHYTDGDVFTADVETAYSVLEFGGIWAWGADAPASMKPKKNLRTLLQVLKLIRSKAITPQRLKLMSAALDAPARPWL